MKIRHIQFFFYLIGLGLACNGMADTPSVNEELKCREEYRKAFDGAPLDLPDSGHSAIFFGIEDQNGYTHLEIPYTSVETKEAKSIALKLAQKAFHKLPFKEFVQQYSSFLKESRPTDMTSLSEHLSAHLRHWSNLSKIEYSLQSPSAERTSENMRAAVGLLTQQVREVLEASGELKYRHERFMTLGNRASGVSRGKWPNRDENSTKFPEVLQRIGRSFSVKNNCLDGEQQKFYDALMDGKSFPKADLTRLLFRRWVSENPMSSFSYCDLRHRIFSLAPAKANDLHKMKVQYEKTLEGIMGRETPYNIGYDSLVTTLKYNALQCRSGTLLFDSIARVSYDTPENGPSRRVILYEQGHMLPGYMVREGTDWRLIGIETTTTGPAKVDYGLASKIKRKLRIVDADDWAITQVFAQCLVDPQTVAKEMLKRTADLYGNKITEPISSVTVKDPFSFGQINVDPGDRKRERMESSSKEEKDEGEFEYKYDPKTHENKRVPKGTSGH